tara:strand:+ start:535 stop:798 length:264 start_codon:yes stop_codon:yes gene_type:complete
LVKVEGTLDELRELMGMGGSNSSVSKPKSTQTQAGATPKKNKRKLSGWNRYVANPRNRILVKSGPRKGRLDLAKMAKKFRSGQKKRK